METNEDVLKIVYEAFNVRDVDAVLRRMHPDVDWPNGMEGGRVYGHSGVREYWKRQWDMIDPHVDPVGFGDDAGRTVVDVHQVIRDLNGKTLLDQIVQHVYSIHGGLIDRMDIRKLDSPPVSDRDLESKV